MREFEEVREICERNHGAQKVIQNLKVVNGDKALFRQWHQKFTTAFGQVNADHEEIAHRMAKEIVLGQNIETIVIGLRTDYGATSQET